MLISGVLEQELGSGVGNLRILAILAAHSLESLFFLPFVAVPTLLFASPVDSIIKNHSNFAGLVGAAYGLFVQAAAMVALVFIRGLVLRFGQPLSVDFSSYTSLPVLLAGFAFGAWSYRGQQKYESLTLVDVVIPIEEETIAEEGQLSITGNGELSIGNHT